MSNSGPVPTPAKPAGNGARKRNLLIFATIVVVALVSYSAYWLLHARYYQSTDDAYVSGDVVQVNSEIAGTILALHVDDTQTVQRGDALVDLDPADARIALASAEAELARSVRQVRSLFAQSGQLRAQIALQQIAVKRVEDDLQRRRKLVEDGAVSGEELSHANDAIRQQRASLDAAQEQLNATEAQIEGTTIDTHPQVLAAAAAVRNAALALHRTHLLAPVAGIVAKRSAQLGARVSPGAPLMAIVPLDQVWVDANFKEGQLADLRVGQPVSLVSDLYGDNTQYRGHIAGLSAGSGGAFALLPPQNASGNWIKIVQRVPVRVLIDAADLKDHPLRVGLSMKVEVDLHDTSGALVAGVVRNAPQPQQDSDGDDPQVETRIAQIIADNAGKRAVAAR